MGARPEKVLLSAYSCLPDAGSEAGIGWHWAQSLAAHGHEVFVLTRASNQSQIEQFVQDHDTEPVHFIFHGLGPVGRSFHWLPFGYHICYFLWQISAVGLARRVHQSGQFSCVQHVTWASFRVPSYMGRLGIPFIFGPVGEGETTPRHLRAGLGWRGRLFEALRRLSVPLTILWMGPTYRAASQILASTEATRDKIPKRYRHKVTTRPAVGIDCYEPPSRSTEVLRSASRLELLYAGRLLPWKGVHLLLQAVALAGKSTDSIYLTVVGTGYDLTRLRKLSRRLKLDAKVSWLPWVPWKTLNEMYRQFDLFTFPSFHDSGGMAVLEAMSKGLPVLCLDLGAPAKTVTDRCGCVITTEGASQEQIVIDMARFLLEMLVDRDKLRRLSNAAPAHAAAYSWECNVRALYGEPLVKAHNADS